MIRPARQHAAALALLAAAARAQTIEAPAPAPAPTPAPPTQQVEVIGGRESDIQQRRQSTAAKIIIGRDEIDRFGDSTLGEVLRRLPGVTTPGAPGRGGAPRLRGLGGGYTQILLDGQRVPPGFSFESLVPDQIERIEILRAPSAETGARAIAGTINIVMREGYQRRINDLRAWLAVENGEITPGASWTRNDSAGALIYNLSMSAFDNHRRSAPATETIDVDAASGDVTGEKLETADLREKRRGLNVSGRLQWRLGDGNSLTLSPTIFGSESKSTRAFELDQRLPAGAAEYDFGDTASASRFRNARVNGQWRQRLESGARLEANGHLGGWRSSSESLRREYFAGQNAPNRTLDDRASTRERSANLTSKLSQTLGGDDDDSIEHSVVGGVEVEAVRRDETHTTLDNGVEVLADGDNLQASSLRGAAYVQDEWQITPHWAAHAGLRWEGIQVRGDNGNGERPTNRSSVATPLLHAVWKPDPKGRDQVRLSLTRSYRTPPLGALIARPSISPRFPASGGNDPTSPDRVGNPELEPELATGIDIAIERYLAGGGLLSANVFRRNISNLMRSVIALETVPWSPVPRYVARQQNIGDAWTQGLELEARFALDQVIEGAPRVEMRANASFFRSRVASVPGPDNRLDQQPDATLNVGADYRFRSLPLTLGGNLNVVPGYPTRLAEEQSVRVSDKRVFDAFVLWTIDPTLGLRVLANNLAARDYESSNTITAPTFTETARSFGASYTNWQFRLEFKL